MKTTLLKLARVTSIMFVLTGVTGYAFGQQYRLHLNNVSGYDVYEVHVSPIDDPYWGPDLLEDDVLDSPGSVDIINIAPGAYDLRLVDEDGDFCVRNNVQFSANRTINITPDWLLGCEFHTSGF
ncbi:MAG TPA: hypothetical protein VGF96_13140 [Terracidiphilus sp.]|jgi:hypothetical protein